MLSREGLRDILSDPVMGSLTFIARRLSVHVGLE